MTESNVIFLDKVGIHDIGSVGGKNASLGEMIQHLTKAGIRVPPGFVTTAEAYRAFLRENQLDQKIIERLKKCDTTDVESLESAGREIRAWILAGKFSSHFEADVQKAFDQLNQSISKKDISFAVRSSATAEDLPDASFAGQQETYLNVRGFSALLEAIKKVYASLYTDRAITYRVHHQFDHSKVALSACVQMMVRSDLASSGVMFTLDTESGFREVVFITAAYGLGETVVQGQVSPDEYVLYKPNLVTKKPAVLQRRRGEKAIQMIYADIQEATTQTIKVPIDKQLQFVLTDAEMHELARMGLKIEAHYQRPMDIEWAKDGETGELYIVQARPETVKSQVKYNQIKRYHLKEKGRVIVEGRSVGEKIGQGNARVLKNASEMEQFKTSEVLVTDMTDPDWEPIMKKASAIVTNRGGRTCHAAIVARELGIPAVVGAEGATEKIKNGASITVSCEGGEVGQVYEGLLKIDIETIDVDKMPPLSTKIMLNVGNPNLAFGLSFLPNFGVGLARIEFIINDQIGIHPNALLHFDELNEDLKKEITKRISGYKTPVDFYVEKLKEGIGTIAAAFYPKPVIVRTSDFKTNEYANLLGGEAYEPKEENPMLGFRGASRYVDAHFQACFELECRALRELRNEMGLTNIEIMIPFTRTVDEAKRVIDVLAKNKLVRGENGLRLIMMCEIPSNAILADEFLQYFDGFSIGSNDLTQLTLGLDRDSNLVASLFDERNEAVKFFLERAIVACQKQQKYIGICGQAPSDYPDLAAWLLEREIESISLNPDTVIKTWLYMAKG